MLKKTSEAKKGDERIMHKIARKMVLPVAVITALSTAQISSAKDTAGGSSEGIILQQKAGPKTDVSDFKKWLEEGWKAAKIRFGATTKEIELPGRLKIEALADSSYNSELSIEGCVPTFSTPSGEIIVKAISSNSLRIAYSEKMELSESDAHALASYAYLYIAAGDASSSSISFYPKESVVILYSRLGESSGSKDGCGYGEALAGFAAFFSDSSNEMVFLKSEFSGDSKAIIAATDNFLGRGAWKTIINGPNKGSSHLFELVKLLMSRSDGKEQLLSYFKFMDKFGIDASKVDVAWDSTHKRYITLGDLAK